MKPRFLVVAALAVLAPLAVAGCGPTDGGSSDRPTEQQLSKAVAGVLPAGVDSSAADCVAKRLEESDLSDAALRAFIDGNTKDGLSGADASSATKVVASAALTCAPQALGGITTTTAGS
jgi:hypothetical protein